MKKRAFTLIELLITMAVIGITAALVLPKLMDIMPDKDEHIINKYRNEISNAVQEFLNDERLYPPQININDPLRSNDATLANHISNLSEDDCTKYPELKMYSSCVGQDNFLGCLLSKKFNGNTSHELVKDEAYDPSSTYFVLQDGSKWFIEESSFPIRIRIDLRPRSIKDIGTYHFQITADGNLE